LKATAFFRVAEAMGAGKVPPLFARLFVSAKQLKRAALLALLPCTLLAFRMRDPKLPTQPPIVVTPVAPLASASMFADNSLLGADVPKVALASPRRVAVARIEPAQFSVDLQANPSALGSFSIGSATRGRLFGGVHLGESPFWVLRAPGEAWGTAETIGALRCAIEEVNRLFPNSKPLHVGQLSRQHGGWLRRHRSHTSGRDADLGFYYTDDSTWYIRASAENFDIERNWALVSSLLRTTRVEYVFLDRVLLELLRAHAINIGEAESLIREAFEGDSPRSEPILRHARGHDDHMHVRFHSEVAVENAIRAKAALGPIARQDASLLALLIQKQRRTTRPASSSATHAPVERDEDKRSVEARRTPQR
jgi:murein endopeptidase